MNNICNFRELFYCNYSDFHDSSKYQQLCLWIFVWLNKLQINPRAGNITKFIKYSDTSEIHEIQEFKWFWAKAECKLFY